MSNQQSKKDNNSVSALIGVSSVDGVSTVPVAVDPVTGRVLVDLAAATTPTISSGSGAPGTTPTKVGDIYVDTSGKKLYIATGTTNSGDWTITN